LEAKDKILIIRFHAFGDLVAIFPYVNALRKAYPDAQIDLLTGELVSPIPENILLFDRVIGIKGGMKPKMLFFWAMLKLPLLLVQRYSLVIDLQADRKSKLLLRLLGHHKAPVFEKYSPYFAGLRYQKAIQSSGFTTTSDFQLPLKLPQLGVNKLRQAGWNGKSKLIVLNPAGFYPSRNWPMTNYLSFIALLEKELPYDFKILFIGDDRIAEKAQTMTDAFPERCLNLVGKTNPIEAFAILPNIQLMVSEDSGLAHMAWVQGVKTCLMLGSTRADWTAPPYEHVINLTSSDLECGNCMEPLCKYGDVRCLTRYTPALVYSQVAKWL
jgi:ADP-heptose:LPS heptosyltransferase